MTSTTFYCVISFVVSLWCAQARNNKTRLLNDISHHHPMRHQGALLIPPLHSVYEHPGDLVKETTIKEVPEVWIQI